MTGITVRVANNYGQQAIYPVCDTSQKLADLIGTKTFTERAIRQIKALGYTISVQQKSL
jgi:hypothetical protein